MPRIAVYALKIFALFVVAFVLGYFVFVFATVWSRKSIYRQPWARSLRLRSFSSHAISIRFTASAWHWQICSDRSDIISKKYCSGESRRSCRRSTRSPTSIFRSFSRSIWRNWFANTIWGERLFWTPPFKAFLGGIILLTENDKKEWTHSHNLWKSVHSTL